MLSSLLFVAVIWQTATIFLLTDEDAINLLDPKIHSKGFFFGDESKQSILNVLCFKKQILFKICKYIQKENQ
jgi:hypothetical protein